ncbi:hypothetical protein MTP99_016655 [Tenebrio molitor]|nr:hypothetical protein MTP99_016655 [Tenebrio molitor]
MVAALDSTSKGDSPPSIPNTLLHKGRSSFSRPAFLQDRGAHVGQMFDGIPTKGIMRLVLRRRSAPKFRRSLDRFLQYTQ